MEDHNKEKKRSPSALTHLLCTLLWLPPVTATSFPYESP